MMTVKHYKQCLTCSKEKNEVFLILNLAATKHRAKRHKVIHTEIEFIEEFAFKKNSGLYLNIGGSKIYKNGLF